jgi:putative membrane protein insertion efficiency factor
MRSMAQAAAYKPVMGALLKGYKATLSPAFVACGIQCRHQPSCSEYCAECVSRHGAWAGAWMTLARLSRCRPGGSHGWDPAPQTLPMGLTSTGVRWFAPWRYGVWSVDGSNSARQ